MDEPTTELEQSIKRKRQVLIAILPTMLTLGNAVCGFGAITFAAKLGPESTVEGNTLLVAALLIFAGMIFDMLDGSAARLTNQTSEMGAQLDSLCDAITFGVAPAFLMLKFSRDHYSSRLLWVIAVLYVLCALLRLARFNAETDEEDDHEAFSGLPSPAAAGVVVSFPIAMRGVDGDLLASRFETLNELGEVLGPLLRYALPFITLAAAALMVSRFRYLHVFNNLMRSEKPRQHLVQLVFALLVIFLVQELAVPLVFLLFAFGIPARSVLLELWSRRKGSTA